MWMTDPSYAQYTQQQYAQYEQYYAQYAQQHAQPEGAADCCAGSESGSAGMHAHAAADAAQPVPQATSIAAAPEAPDPTAKEERASAPPAAPPSAGFVGTDALRCLRVSGYLGHTYFRILFVVVEHPPDSSHPAPPV